VSVCARLAGLSAAERSPTSGSDKDNKINRAIIHNIVAEEDTAEDKRLTSLYFKRASWCRRFVDVVFSFAELFVPAKQWLRGGCLIDARESTCGDYVRYRRTGEPEALRLVAAANGNPPDIGSRHSCVAWIGGGQRLQCRVVQQFFKLIHLIITEFAGMDLMAFRLPNENGRMFEVVRTVTFDLNTIAITLGSRLPPTVMQQ